MPYEDCAQQGSKCISPFVSVQEDCTGLSGFNAIHVKRLIGWTEHGTLKSPSDSHIPREITRFAMAQTWYDQITQLKLSE